uniref:Uncharacterized protein n=1 Tax=Anguilla anguilla TaxID=7936 RepID=A0A0E9SSU4_ANGAN
MSQTWQCCSITFTR